MSRPEEESKKYSKKSFIELALAAGVLKFGEFTLKSGRQSPYFFNAGLFYDGMALQSLGQFYANKLLESDLQVKHLFGPAYKGLPLATATAIALAERGCSVKVTFNRKEVKDHGEGGSLIGAPLQGPIIVIDDVITAGTAFREAQQQIGQQGAKLSAVIIALDRCETGISDQSAVKEIEAEGIQVLSLINFYDLVAYLKNTGDDDQVAKMLAYHQQYGTAC